MAEALARLGRDLTGTLDRLHIAQLVAQGVVELLGSRNSAMFTLEPTDGTLHLLAWSGADSEPERHRAGAGRGGGRARRRRATARFLDLLQDGGVRLSESLGARLNRFNHRATVSVPLIARDQVIGALALADDDRQYTGDELQVLQAFADQAALALDNARLYASARDSLERLRETQAQLVQAGKLLAVGQLVSGVAHELNNPLSVIIGYSQLLATRKLPDNVTRPLERILQQADRMAKIVQSLLLFARQHPPEHARLDLHGIIEQTLALRINQLTLSGMRRRAGLRGGAARDQRRSAPAPAGLPQLAAQCRAGHHGGGQARRPHRVPHERRRRRPRGARLGHRRRPGHRPRDAAPRLRAVLHHQGRGRRHRPRPLRVLRHRAGTPRTADRREPSRTHGLHALVVCAVRTLDINGEEFFRSAVDHESALRERFVFITGDTANLTAWESLQRTDVPVLETPFPTGSLLDAVRRVVSREGH